MTNEDLVREIQGGKTELYSVLWSQVRAFIVLMAIRRYSHVEDVSGIDIDDLIQSGFLGLVEAVRGYDASSGASFLTYLKLHLQRAFNAACGVRTKRAARDPIHRAKSLDAPVDADDPDGATFGDLQPCQDDCIAAADDEIFQEQLRAAIDRLLKRLSPKAADVIRSTLILDEPIAHVAERYHTTPGRIISSRTGYLIRLRELSRSTREGAALRRFLDEGTNWYLTVGKEAFTRTQTSAVESLVLQREHLEKKYLREGLQ